MQDSSQNPTTLPRHTVGEWVIRSIHIYDEPFVAVTVDAEFTGPDNQKFTVPAFYDGKNIWRIRFNPGVAGHWSYRTLSRPSNPDLKTSGHFEVTENQSRGFLRPHTRPRLGLHLRIRRTRFHLW